VRATRHAALCVFAAALEWDTLYPRLLNIYCCAEINEEDSPFIQIKNVRVSGMPNAQLHASVRVDVLRERKKTEVPRNRMILVK
jgi:hypothetical protein